MRIKELKLIPPSKQSSAVLIEFMKEHEKGLKAIKALAEIKEIAYDGYNNGRTSYATFQCEKIINKINEVEDEHKRKN